MPILNGKPTFSAGRAFMIGNSANPTPARALVPQSQSFDFKRKTESLFGEKQFAIEVGAGEMEITGKVEFGKVNARVYADILFGAGSTTGSYKEADAEAGTVPASSTYVITVANATTFLIDLGVVNADTGAIYSRVASGSEVAGASYSVVTSGANKGKYTFAVGDASANMRISYAYSVGASGETLVMTNPTQGPTGRFQGVHVLPWGSSQDMIVFNNCIAVASFTLDYTAAADSNDQVGTFTFAEAA